MGFEIDREHDACGVGQEVDIRALARIRHGMNPADVNDPGTFNSGCESFYCNQHRIGVLPDGTGDGAGITTNIPIAFYNKVLQEELGVQAAYEYGDLGIAQLFLPKNVDSYKGQSFEQHIEKLIGDDPRFKFVGLRDLPVDDSILTEYAKETRPKMAQAFFEYADDLSDKEKKKLSLELNAKIDEFFKEYNKEEGREERDRVTVASCSSKNVTWKGMLNTREIPVFYKDLHQQGYISGVWQLLYHGRMSTNSTPEWAYAHPNGNEADVGHNGEFNTIAKNREARRAFNNEVSNREDHLNADLGADSRHFAAEASELVADGISGAEAIVKLLPPAFEQDPNLSESAKAMLRFNSLSTTPYTGPAHINFTSDQQGAALDPSGLRPSRYVITISELAKDDELGARIAAESREKGWPYDLVPEGWEVAKMYIGSEDTYNDKALAEVGEFALVRDSLGAGDMLLHDTDGRFYKDREYVEKLADPELNGGIDYTKLVEKQLPAAAKPDYENYQPQQSEVDVYTRMHMLLWHQEAVDVMLIPMIQSGKMGITAMGDDGQIIRKSRPTHMADYFKQQFAQITNPALDFIREPESFSHTAIVGPNLSLYYSLKGGELVQIKDHPKDLFYTLESPYMMDNQLSDMKDKLDTEVIDITYEIDPTNPKASMQAYKDAIAKCLDQAAAAAKQGKVIVVSDRNVSPTRQAFSDIQAVAAINKHLVAEGCRAGTSIVVESGQMKDTHHAAVLFSYGATAVNGYLINELINQKFKEQPVAFKGMTLKDMFKSFYKAADQSHGKIMAKMGMSNHMTYVGASLMEARAIDTQSFDGAFAGTYSPVRGLNEDDFAFTHLAAHHIAVSRYKDFAALEKVFNEVMQSVDSEVLGEPTKRSLYGIFANYGDQLKGIIHAPESKQAGKMAVVFTKIIGEKQNLGLIKDEDERFAKQEALGKAVVAALEGKVEQIIGVVKRTELPEKNLLTHGIYGMREGGVPHRFGPEMVRAAQVMFGKHEVEREAEIETRLAEIRQELAGDPEIDSELKSYEAVLRKYAHFPRDEEGRVKREFIENYTEPSQAYKEFVEVAQKLRKEQRISDRDFIEIKVPEGRKPLSDEEMQTNPQEIISGRTRVGQMSKGALTPIAWETIAEGEWSVRGNPATGEGGEEARTLATKVSPPNKQIASGRFGISPEMIASCVDQNGVIQIKIVQGAKPGEGGELPAGKVAQWVATLRQSTPGVNLPSPAPMHDIYSIEDLQGLIFELKSFGIKVDVKIGAMASTEIVGLGAAKAGADVITVAGHEGGTGATPAISPRNTGQDWMVEGAKLDACLVKNNLRDSVKLVAEGGMSNHMDMLMALKYFDGIGQGTFEMIANKCIMARVCNKPGIKQEHVDAYRAAFREEHGHEVEELPMEEMLSLVNDQFCPTGVTNSAVLFKPEPWRIEQYRMDFAAGLYSWLKENGYDSVEAFRADDNLFVTQPKDVLDGIFGEFDFDALVAPRKTQTTRQGGDRNKGIHTSQRKDDEWKAPLEEWLAAVENGENPKPVFIESETSPYDRSVGSRTSGMVCLKVTDGRIEMEAYPNRAEISRNGAAHIKLSGNAGQSFGFALSHGLLMECDIAQDGVGKSGAGGTIVIAPKIPEGHPCPEVYMDNCVVGGNSVGYGNQGTEIFARGKLGGRANVCAHGGLLVCEGAKDFGAEFMTNGTFISLGEVGNYFGNAQSGGLSILYDPDKSQLEKKVSHDDLRVMNNDEGQFAIQTALKKVLQKHYEYTGSTKAKGILDNWEVEKNNFSYLVPKAYDKFKTQEAVDVMNAVDRDRKTSLSPGESATRINMQLAAIRSGIQEGELVAQHASLAEEILQTEGEGFTISKESDSMVDAQLKRYLGKRESMSIREVVDAIQAQIDGKDRPNYVELMAQREKLEQNHDLVMVG